MSAITTKEKLNPNGNTAMIGEVKWNYLRPKDNKGNLILPDVEYFLTHLLPKTDVNPIGQRPAIFRDKNNPKSIAIMESMIIKRICFGSITLVKTKDGRWEFESLDGGHRKRAIRDFVNNEFKVGGKYYSEFTDSEKGAFLKTPLSFVIYEPLTTYMKGVIFRDINETTDVNNQEQLNSYGNVAIANAIRESVRPMTMHGKVTTPHDLFEQTAGGNFKWIDKSNNRLTLEELVSRFYYRIYDGGDVGSKDFKEVESMYLNITGKETKRVKKEVDKLLDFLLSMAHARKSFLNPKGMPWGEVNTLANLYLYIGKQFGSWSLIDGVAFYDKFKKRYDEYFFDVNDLHKDVGDFDFEKAGSTIQQLFRDYTTDISSALKQKQLMKWVSGDKDEEFLYIDEILLKDPTRKFPSWMKEVKLMEQGNVCAVDGKPLKWEDAHAAHIDAHTKGGRTIYSNLAMVRKDYNSDSGSTNLNDYIEQYKLMQKAA